MKSYTFIHIYYHINFKGEFANFFIGVSDDRNYDIIWTENGDVIDRFILEVFTFKELHQYLWNESIIHIAAFTLNNVMLWGVRYASKKNGELTF